MRRADPSRPWTSSRPSSAARRSSFKLGIARRELLEVGRLALLGQRQVGLDRLAHALVVIAGIERGVAIRRLVRQCAEPSLNLSGPPGGPSSERFRCFSPRAQMPRTDFRLRPRRSPIASNERLSA